jgi:hypothetical protein
MNYIVTSLLVISFLMACSPSEKKTEKEKSPFRTTAPSLLYFKNIRSTSYSVQEQANTRMEMYKLNAFSSDTDRPIIYPIIVNHWLEDKAYLFLNFNEFEKGIYRPVTIKVGAEETIILDPVTIPNQYDYAVSISEALDKELPLEIKGEDGEFHPLMENQKDRSAYLICLRDYLRLIEKN